MIEYKVGLDPEFMVKYKGKIIYPILECRERHHVDSDLYKIHQVGYDEFGHCAEIRPAPGKSGKEVVLNTVAAMADLPPIFNYYSDNTHCMEKKAFIQTLRTIGRKDLSTSENIYDIDILDDCPMDIKVRQANKRLLFCGCHMHLSATESFTHHRKDKKNIDITRNYKLPVKALVWLFDSLIFEALDHDKHFDVGRYRQRGFYEDNKAHGGFEYRSLGASALTPTRIRLIVDIMIELTKSTVRNLNEFVFQASKSGIMLEDLTFSPKVGDMLSALARTKAPTSDLRKLWVPFD